ncbi:DUF2381 family protein [Comamonas sp. JC664]|uniref:DUF2381 family protein n=1 Tax=Comamonas sp. JC664 TaxID=2801917 RepID=UPI00174963E0|nr:DUF2381 family protein [Comamonas sp. JC664]MBL0692936.1 DUF2381 family protein [Comamonas sp. JC664]
MHVTSSVVLLGLALFSGSATAQGNTASMGGARRIELKADATGELVAIAISPGLSTVILFDSDLVHEGVELEERSVFSNVDIGRTTMRLVPSDKVTHGEKFRLSVRFRDGAAPTGVAFVLTVHPARPDSQVEVYRNTRTVESYQQEAREARAETIRCKEDNARLVADHGAPDGLAGLLATGGMDVSGVVGRTVTEATTFDPKSALEPFKVHSYRAMGRGALEVSLRGTRAERPWVASGATLRSRSGVELKVLRIWQEAPIISDVATRIVVEAELPSIAAQGDFSLKMWEATGPRTVTISNVRFP